MRASLFTTVVLCATGAFGASFSFTGNFVDDNDLEVFQFTVSGPSYLKVQSWGYGGGTNAAGSVIASGGFATTMTVFDPTGMQYALDNLGGSAPNCFGRNIDGTTGACYDAVVYDSNSLPLLLIDPGQYTIVLSQQGNNALGFYGDGYSEDGDPNFTGTRVGMPEAMFLDPGFDSSQRTSAWALDYTVDAIKGSDIPEPGTTALLLMGGAVIAAGRMRRFRN